MLNLDGPTLTVRDLQSPSGTWVNLHSIRRNEHVLANGDTVRIGDLVIRIELETSRDDA
jgi:predicted component of type VI protein secretion system